ncbi:MAG: EF-Tu/IF-2/RF-3 family GTPase, partial [Ralstonia sp.]|uniref:EF-Tu/IF-2/RF-3 family GTPase n=1 Tax=Ralstonia sp. TaxID=54061 RepID=UPI003F7DC91A
QPYLSRRDSVPPDGGPPGSNVDFIREQLLDPYNIIYGVLEPLLGGNNSRNLDEAAALCAAMNEWQIAEYTDPEPRLRASILVPLDDPDAAVREIERRADDWRFCQVQVGGKTTEPIGRRRYWPIFEAVLKHVPVRAADPEGPLQLQITSLDYSSYVGKIGIGRINRGRIKAGQDVVVLNGPDSTPIKGRINQVLNFKGLERVLVDEAVAGDIVLINGIEELGIGCTVCAPDAQEALPMLKVDEPTLTMNFCVNTSPLAGREGKFVTSRQLRDRLDRELKSNVALRVKDTGDDTIFEVSGRGELHLTILVENMRREGYELAVSRPRVVFKDIDGVKCEPFERLTVDVEDSHQGGVMEELGRRKGELLDMASDGKGRTRLEYRIPARGLIGFQGEFLTLTRGTGLISHIFDDYSPVKEGDLGERHNGVLISQDDGAAVAYALWKLQDRGRMFVSPGDALYEGMIIGIHSRDNDLVVNPIKGKQLTNVRASGTDEAVRLVPPIQMSLEYAVEFIADDELVEVTPKSIRLRKRHLKEHERKRASREEAV